MKKDDLRKVPRFPLPREKTKFVFNGVERIFAVRDISLEGMGISLLDLTDSLHFPEGQICQAELKLEAEPFHVSLIVKRVTAWSVGFMFEDLTDEQLSKIRAFVDPLQIGASLKPVDQRGAPDAFLEGMSAWYHGNSGADFFFWNDSRGGLHRALLCLGKRFWEWTEAGGVTTGEVARQEGDKVALHRDATPDPQTRLLVRKVLEHADVLDYRLVSFLRERT